jgi:hypothetical protein
LTSTVIFQSEQFRVDRDTIIVNPIDGTQMAEPCEPSCGLGPRVRQEQRGWDPLDTEKTCSARTGKPIPPG